jgi:hypothetical protein
MEKNKIFRAIFGIVLKVFMIRVILRDAFGTQKQQGINTDAFLRI